MPNFFVIGANRSGTTSLHEYLGQHPDVFMCPRKEPSYFAPKSDAERALWPDRQGARLTLDEYRALFAGVRDESVVGESSTIYLTHAATPSLIRAAVPEARLVAILRNPVDRAFSDYSLHRSWGTEPLSFADAISAELDHEGPVGGRMRGYVLTGFYSRSLERWLGHFPAEQLRIYLYEDLTRDPAGLVRDCFEHLGVDPTFPVDTAAHRNASRYEPKSRTLDRLGRSRLAVGARRVLPSAAWTRVRTTVRRANSVRPALPDDVRARLVALYRDDIARTEEIIGRDLSAWRT